MKNLLLIILFCCLSTNLFSQIGAKDKTVLKDFILGYDSENTIIKKGVDINGANITEFENNISIVRLNEYFYSKDVVLVFIDNTLYSVRYTPGKEKQYLRYKNKLSSTIYNIKDQNGISNWFNKYVEIYEVENNGEKSFIHYDSVLLEKYPQYKDL